MAEEVRVECTCTYCKTKKTYTLPAAHFTAWREGMLIQDAFPEMSAEDREFLISGLCPKCWDKLFVGDGSNIQEGKASEW